MMQSMDFGGFKVADWTTEITGLPVRTRTLDVSEAKSGSTVSILQVTEMGDAKLRIASTDVQLSKEFRYFKEIKASFKNYLVVTKAKLRIVEKQMETYKAAMDTTSATFVRGENAVEIIKATGLMPQPLDSLQPTSVARAAPPLSAHVDVLPIAADAMLFLVSLGDFPTVGQSQIIFCKLLGANSHDYFEHYVKNSSGKLHSWIRKVKTHGIASNSVFFDPQL